MLPSILANEIRESTRRFLINSYEASDGFFHGIIQRFVEGKDGVGKGPYLQVGLPFRLGVAGKGFFQSFEIEHPGFAHQENAWSRLASDREAASTLVATGTGSGKTECFLYPVLDHCLRARQSGQTKGIKALVIYPMNALASDQARRFAEVIAATPAFKDLRVGLYVGGGSGRPGGESVMTPTTVITDRDTLRKAPPDILLTNYKMLDYLLIRPKDRKLWEHNGPHVLRYVVVDELHTFDGAQGTDLSLLLRRLRARLKTPEGQLICIGTSATLGDGDTGPLRDYARQIFSAPFSAESVITESRDSVAEFLGDKPIVHVLEGRADLSERLDPGEYRSPHEAIAAWFPLFFPSEPIPMDVRDPDWRSHLGSLLKQHLLFHNLLRLLKGGIGDWPQLHEQLAGPLPELARPYASQVLDALVAVLAWARDPTDARRPLTTIRVQVWMRELRRLVATVHATGDQVTLHSAADLKAKSDQLYLPLVQCSECHTTGWLARRPANAVRLDHELETIYNAWFRSAPEVSRLYPRVAVANPQCEARAVQLCGRCGALQDAGAICTSCGHDELVAVWEMLEQGQTVRDQVASNWHQKLCPACGVRDRLLLVGARNATLGAQLIEQSWATPYNDDKKLIAFSDSVQDAAHRAGFFGSRTYLNNVRMAMTRVLDSAAEPAVAWTEYLTMLPERWLDAPSPFRMPVEKFVTEFIGPNMTWQQEWDQLRDNGRLPERGRLLERVRRRLAWQAVSEFTYLSRRGRTLDRLGVATLSPPADALDDVSHVLSAVLSEKFGLRDIGPETVRQWLWGFVIRLKQRGAVTHPELEFYFREGALFSFISRQGRELWLPNMSTFAPYPVALTLGTHRDADRLVQVRGKTWYQEWLQATLGREHLLPRRADADIYGAALQVLTEDGLLVAMDGIPGRSWALNADRLLLDTRVVQLRSEKGKRALSVPKDLALRLQGMPCLDAMQENYVHSEAPGGAGAWMARRFHDGDIRRVISAEHTGLLGREAREALEIRFKTPAAQAKPWFENLLSATPTLEMGVDIGSLSSVLLCSVPPSQASYLQRIGRAGRRDGNAMVVTLADGASPHDLYFYEQPHEMMAGLVSPPGVFLQAAEVLRRQLLAFCIDCWVATGIPDTAFPDKTSAALDALDKNDVARFPYNLLSFIQKDEVALLDRFFAIMGADLHSRVEQRLRDYMFGNGDLDGLRVGLLKLLEDLSKERGTYRRKADETKKLITALKAQPADDATKNKIAELARERDKSLELSKEIGGRDLLGTLTDAGLIPNYAFPEAGIELKSLLWRKRNDGEEGGGYITLPAERYERPASSALSEFAPESRFYANRRRVEIDQINMQLAKAEQWRLCPSCHHTESIDMTGDANPACPRCGDAMWANVSQKRTLLRFKQAMANANDARSRIDDSSDDREPRFFVRQLLVDFEPSDVEIAWKLESESVAFGFEFIRRANFRDINFGEMGKNGETFRVADRDSVRPGFKLCRHCGMVQKPPRRSTGGVAAPAQAHARDCAAFGGDSPENIIDCLYLYREFSSEALRILVPYTRSGLDETVLQSFMAALQLGLKKRFGGKVDHLRITPQEEPGRDGGPRRQYVLLFDSVPGGTGYLHQLLSEEAQTLGEVLEQAYAVIQSCTCQSDPEKDGCYRCVYQYKQGRAMAKVSRRSAASVLGDLVASLDRLERVKSISEIFINPNFDSVLESRFIESLRRLSGAKDPQGHHALPTVRVMQEVVQGKSGYLLEVGSERYWVRPQASLGPEQGVGAHSKPDFLLVPARSTSVRRPVAVFADGWAFHRETLREDAKKRSALVASGRYWVWSVTWDDVESALAGVLETDLTVHDQHARNGTEHPLVSATALGLGIPPSVREENAVAGLLRFLGTETGQGPGDQGEHRLQRSAAVIMSRLIAMPGSPEQKLAATVLNTVAEALPDGRHDAPDNAGAALSLVVHAPVVASYAWPMAFMSGIFDTGFGAVRLAAELAPTQDALKQSWREWLALFNRLQVLPNTYLLEAAGLLHGDYSGLGTGPGAPVIEMGADPWMPALSGALGDLQPGLAMLRDSGLPAPDQVGYELASPSGDVIAEAELIWESARVVVLAAHQVEQRSIWEAEGWKVVEASQSQWSMLAMDLIKE